MENHREYLGDQMAIVIWVPKDSIRLTVDADVDNGDEKPFAVSMELDEDGISEARNDYLLIDPDDNAFAKYVIRPEFKAFLEAGEKAGKETDEIFREWDIYKDLILKEMY